MDQNSQNILLINNYFMGNLGYFEKFHPFFKENQEKWSPTPYFQEFENFFLWRKYPYF